MMLLKSLFMRLILGLVFAMLAVRVHSCARVHQAKELEVTSEDIPAAQKEVPDGFPISSARNMGLGGRKMTIHKDFTKEIKKDQGLQGRSSEDISGMDDNATKKSIGRSRDQLKDQKDAHKPRRKTLKSECLGTRPFHVPSSNAMYHQDSRSVTDKANLNSPSRSDKQLSPKDEMQGLPEAQKRIVNLIHKDYSGMNRPRHKPPINNHLPIH